MNLNESDEKVQAATAEIQDLTEKRGNLLEEVKKSGSKRSCRTS